MSHDCSQWHDRFAQHLDGALPPDQARAFDSHLGGCPECRQALAETRAIVTALREPPVPAVSDAAVEEALARFRAERATAATGAPPPATQPRADAAGPADSAAPLAARRILRGLSPRVWRAAAAAAILLAAASWWWGVFEAADGRVYPESGSFDMGAFPPHAESATVTVTISLGWGQTAHGFDKFDVVRHGVVVGTGTVGGFDTRRDRLIGRATALPGERIRWGDRLRFRR